MIRHSCPACWLDLKNQENIGSNPSPLLPIFASTSPTPSALNTPTIHRYTASELWSYLQAPTFKGALPCSQKRAWSYLHNPRMRPTDTVAYVWEEAREVIGYRTLLPDHARGIRFAWLSGVWVRADRRRQGIASKLLQAALVDWMGRLMLTNYVPASGAVASQAGFQPYLTQMGMRYYLRGNVGEIVRQRIAPWLEPIGQLADLGIHTLQSLSPKHKPNHLANPQFHATLSPQIIQWLAPKQQQEFTQRGQAAWQHILTYPWVTAQPQSDLSEHAYYFTEVAKQHERYLVSLSPAQEGLQAFLMLLMTNGHVTLPYQYASPEALIEASDWLWHWLSQQRALTFTSFQPAWIQASNRKKGYWWTQKPQKRLFLASPRLLPELPPSHTMLFQDGEGDKVFV